MELHQIDALIAEAGGADPRRAREDAALLERLRDPRVLVRAKELVGPPEQKGRHAAILCIERIGYALRDQESAEILLTIAARSQTPYEVGTALAGLARCTPPTRSPPRRSWSSPAILEGDELSAD